MELIHNRLLKIILIVSDKLILRTWSCNQLLNLINCLHFWLILIRIAFNWSKNQYNSIIKLMFPIFLKYFLFTHNMFQILNNLHSLSLIFNKFSTLNLYQLEILFLFFKFSQMFRIFNFNKFNLQKFSSKFIRFFLIFSEKIHSKFLLISTKFYYNFIQISFSNFLTNFLKIAWNCPKIFLKFQLKVNINSSPP